VRQVLAFAPERQGVCMVEMRGTAPKQVVVQIRDHGALKVAGQRGQHFSEGDGAALGCASSVKVPFGFVQNGVATLFATHLKDVAETRHPLLLRWASGKASQAANNSSCRVSDMATKSNSPNTARPAK
jgi:hypothetical protein